jgi:serine/threonine protein kinase
MGIVYEAVETGLDRKVALKTMIVHPFANPKDAALDEERFLREAQLCARLPKHPHIVGVYEAGIIDGRRFLSMELIEGTPMAAWRDDPQITFRQEIEVLRLVALAVHHAHEQGIIHRDLKPANILIDARHEPHVMDFGLAKMVGENLSLSLTGAGMVVGTPAYMSPEQAQGLKTTDRRTDVYALGVMLFETLTGHPPFEGATAVELLMKAAKNPVPSASVQMKVKLSPAQAKGLDDICHKALAKKPAERYRDASVFAADLGRWLKGEEVRVVVMSTRRMRRSPRVNWGLIAGVAVVAVVAGLVFLNGQSTPAIDPRVEKLAAEKKAADEKLKAAEQELQAMGTRLLKAVEPRNAAALKPGLIGEYYGGVNFDNPGLRRIDPEARWTMREGQSWPGGPASMVSVRWRGYLKIPETGPYVFHVWVSDGLRLLIDNTEIIANWTQRKVSFDTGTGILEQGYHSFVLETFASSGWGGANFSFKKSGDAADAKTGAANFFYDPSAFTALQQSATPDHFDWESLPGAQEAETLPVLECSSLPPFSIPFGRKKGILIWGKKPKIGDHLKLGFNVPEAGERTLILALSRVKNAGTFKISVNGKVVQEKLDLWSPGNYVLEYEFKKTPLVKGQNELEFTLIGSHPNASEWTKGDGVMKLGFDYLRLR